MRADVVKKTGDARRQLRIAVIHRIDWLAHVQRLLLQQRHQLAGFPIAPGHKVCQLYDPSPRSANCRSVSPLDAEIVGVMVKCGAWR